MIMSQLIVYQYPKCSTCRKAVKWLENQGHELQLKHIVDTPPSEEELNQFISLSGLELKKFFNTSGEVYKELGLKDKLASMSAQEQVALLAQHGKLIKRPIVSDGNQVTVGFKEEEYNEKWAK
jgi:arsenate reductase